MGDKSETYAAFGPAIAALRPALGIPTVGGHCMKRAFFHLPRVASLLGFTAAALVLAGCRSVPNSLATHDPGRWEKDIAVFQASDATNAPPPGGVIFVGSSSIRLWKSLPRDFPGVPVANRGFGGSQLADVVHYADRIVVPYRPRQVVIYAGGNDINDGKSPEVVFGDFVALVKKLRRELPGARLAYISSAPNPKRWEQVEKVRRLNDLARGYARRHRVDFIDVFPLMLGADGLPKPDIYVEDRLHMNERGYAIWKEAVSKHLAWP